MARPQKHPKTGVYQFRKRVPDRLRALVGKGEVVRSLGTKDPAEARVRWLKVAAEVEERWANLGSARTLSNRDAHAYAGEFYRWALARQPDPSPEVMMVHRHAVNELARYREKAVVDEYDALHLRSFWGDVLDEFLAERGLTFRPDSYERLFEASMRALLQANRVTLRQAEGDYSPDPEAARFPPPPSDRLPWRGVFDAYAAEAQLAPKTRRHWANVVGRFMDRVGSDDLQAVTRDHLLAYKAELLETGLHPNTVRNVRLAAIKAMCAWAVENGKLKVNPADGVSVRAVRPRRERERGFTQQEATRILLAALARPGPRVSRDQAAARRWLPWLCAYTGARINELTVLGGSDVQQREVQGGPSVWVLHIRAETTKTLTYRDVPLHPHLVEQGFLDFVRSKGSGPLFFDAARSRTGSAVHPIHMKTAERLARWVRKEVGIDDVRIDPNHAWRHRFKSVARSVGMSHEVREHVQGHALRTEGEGYGDFWPEVMLREISKMPRYDIPTAEPPSTGDGT